MTAGTAKIQRNEGVHCEPRTKGDKPELAENRFTGHAVRVGLAESKHESGNSECDKSHDAQPGVDSPTQEQAPAPEKAPIGRSIVHSSCPIKLLQIEMVAA